MAGGTGNSVADVIIRNSIFWPNGIELDRSRTPPDVRNCITSNEDLIGFNGNFAAAIDDYELKLRFMNDLATYRIDVSWLWTLVHHQAIITKDGHLRRPALTDDGVEPAENAEQVKAGARFTPDLFQKLWDVHNEWTYAFFAEQDRRGDPGRFDRAKAPVIMELLKRQLLSPRYIQHSARVLFVVGQAGAPERAQILDAIFDLSREEIVRRVTAGASSRVALAAHDYVYDIFEGVDTEQRPEAKSLPVDA